jgi:4-hydroxy-tetrahydrodipicolinate synthase
MVLESTSSAASNDPKRIQEILEMLKPHSLMPALKGVMAVLSHDPTWLRVRAPLVAMTLDEYAKFAKEVDAFNIDTQHE